MTRTRINKKTLEIQLPAILQEQFRADGLSRDTLPAWTYITANTRYSAEGLNNKCQELYGQTLHQFLRERGFGVRNTGKWPTDDEETIRSLKYYVDSAEHRKGWSEGTIDSIESVINKVYEAIQNEGLDIEMLDLGQCSTHEERLENVQHAITIIDYMDRNLADSTMGNYPRYFEEYYNIVKNQYQINVNPVEEALDEFEWYRTNGDSQPVTEAQLNAMWNTLEALDECPVNGYDLHQWRLWMKILLIVLIAVGPRSNEVERLDVRKRLHFGDDPYVHFDERKNLRRDEGPIKVPIMMGSNSLQAYQDYIEAIGGNVKLVPSPESESGCRTPGTLNEWLKRLCKLADVRLDDGSFPTIQNFRQFWKTLYKKALAENRDEIKFVSQEDGKKDHESDERDYIDDVVNRQHVRNLGRKYFDNVLDLGDFPEALQEEVDQINYIDKQIRLTELNTNT